MGVRKATVDGNIDPLKGNGATNGVDAIPNPCYQHQVWPELAGTEYSIYGKKNSESGHDRHKGVYFSFPLHDCVVVKGFFKGIKIDGIDQKVCKTERW